ncbi:NmrA family NAD(P)-binding protein [Mesorhizobium sp. ESP6-5]|uniref:NmrA family NAD(P)-binding protein n=1 Tax=unclassified Mesorhizobium TaxID=325217 RepID=UPI00112C5E9F|nr:MULTISPECIES: NmrA family NAD(P)-binding protein [unclassified Mesorhizobium]MBZ9756230.1 NmrA family NAD(P)-binding protein [Mesorhizobium sp. ESP6-5]TPL83445.1 NmrA family transcriptional regulator [Mesorhizobium sp. B2-3-14]
MSQAVGKISSPRTVVVIGATNEVGKAVAQVLTGQGHIVRGVARSLGVALDDSDALASAFSGADSAYVMIPFDVTAPDLHRFEDEVGARLAAAIAKSGVRRVVLLSGLNAHLRMGTSLGAALMEERLAALGLDELVFLRASFFMENFAKGMGFVRQAASGIFMTPFRGDLPMPLIAASDVGQRAAALLDATRFPSERVIELHGGGYYTFEQATAILGSAMGRQVTYKAAPFTEARAGMIANGLSPSFADALGETAASFNKGERWALEAPSIRNATPTTFESWAQAFARAQSAA